MNTVFLEPLDVLYLRGNKLFGGAGDHGEALMPPWPSLAAGAIRSRLLADGDSLAALGDFRLSGFGLARRADNGQIEPLWPLPADLVVSAENLGDATYLRPLPPPAGIHSSLPLPLLASFCASQPAKPKNGLWLKRAGMTAWLAGQPIRAEHLLSVGQLWQADHRLGIALDPSTRSAADGKIYTAETVALCKQVGFIAQSRGHQRQLLDGSLVRLGGDGRAAKVSTCTVTHPEPDWSRIERSGRFRLLLTTPGIFPAGWQPAGVPATLVAASVCRAETISGWDVRIDNDKAGGKASGKPKPAQRVAPVGSVYWYDCGYDCGHDSPGKLADLAALKALVDNGLSIDDPTRRAEGFNHCFIAPWAEEN